MPVNTLLPLAAAAALFVALPGPCFALWGIERVTPARAKEYGMEIRLRDAGPKSVIVELEIKTEEISAIHLRFGTGDSPRVSAQLQEDRSKPGRVVVQFTVNRGELDQTRLWIWGPRRRGGTIYELKPAEFVEASK